MDDTIHLFTRPYYNTLSRLEGLLTEAASAGAFPKRIPLAEISAKFKAYANQPFTDSGNQATVNDIWQNIIGPAIDSLVDAASSYQTRQAMADYSNYDDLPSHERYVFHLYQIREAIKRDLAASMIRSLSAHLRKLHLSEGLEEESKKIFVELIEAHVNKNFRDFALKVLDRHHVRLSNQLKTDRFFGEAEAQILKQTLILVLERRYQGPGGTFVGLMDKSWGKKSRASEYVSRVQPEIEFRMMSNLEQVLMRWRSRQPVFEAQSTHEFSMGPIWAQIVSCFYDLYDNLPKELTSLETEPFADGEI